VLAGFDELNPLGSSYKILTLNGRDAADPLLSVIVYLIVNLGLQDNNLRSAVPCGTKSRLPELEVCGMCYILQVRRTLPGTCQG
jgi:hypothetical protein